MSGFVILRLGNLFDGPADLVVLPCSTNGTVTQSVAQDVISRGIPAPRHSMMLGEIEILPLLGFENVAQYSAYAASVQNMRSTAAAIRNIGIELGRATQSWPAIRSVSAPLLGTGAGGLDNHTSATALADGFRDSAADGSVLTISVLSPHAYETLVTLLDRPGTGTVTHNPRVFISYTESSEAQKHWIAELGAFLRANGIEARLDQWHLRRGMDLPQWMTNELDLADRVLIITDAQYARRADGRAGGVGWETMLIQGDMSNLPANSTKYLVLVREPLLADGLPRYLKTKYCLHWRGIEDEAAVRNELLRELLEIPLEPPLKREISFLI